ncbi:MAG: EamA family transporter [Candidatus Omnitrophica bacterium]|nr:EamA family transporter [Candidatus Omnitrophota bacterium]
MKYGHLTLKIFLMIVLNDIGDTISQALMKQGLIATGISSVGMGNIAEFLSRGVSSPILWLGILAHILNFFIWIIIIYKIDLSIAMPVGSFSYILVPIAAMIFFHDRIEPLRWLGIAFIMLGIYFVSKSKSSVDGRPGHG